MNDLDLDEEYHKMIYKHHYQKIKEINLFPVSDRIKHNIEKFLTYSGVSDIKLKLYTIQFIDGKVGLKWELDNGGYVSAFFEDDDKWSWETKQIIILKDSELKLSTDLCDKIEKKLTYSGKCNFTCKNRHGKVEAYFHFPDEVEKLITLEEVIPEEFKTTINNNQVQIFWETNQHDGIISGYGVYNNKIVYIDNVYETFFTRRRIFGVYELSFLDKFYMMIQRSIWFFILGGKMRWNLYHFLRKINSWFKKPYVNKYLEKKNNFKISHKLLGYYEW